MDYSSRLNERQYEAVTSSSQYLRIVAGAGSGKTRVLTYRIAHLIASKNVDPRRILAITFTNKVADEMKQRASALVEEATGSKPPLRISTFHSFCARFLRTECDAINYPVGFTIFDEDDVKKMIKNIAVDLGYKKGDEIVKGAIHFIDVKKSKGQYPEDIRVNSNYGDDKVFLHFYAEYEKRKRECFALDFDDLLLQTIKVLENNEDIHWKWVDKFDHILIDEFQDTNDVQYKLLKLLLSDETCVYVVGDPDQTIYTWRGANLGIILRFEKEFRGCETIILNENYRSTTTILDAANKLIAHNKKRVPKDLFTSNQGEESDIKVHVAISSQKEAEWVAREIATIGRKNKDEFGEPIYKNIAILYRSSYVTRPFESSLKDLQIPYRIFGGTRFYERAEIKDLLAYFSLLINDKNNIAFDRIVNVPRRGVGDSSVAIIRAEASKHGLSQYEYMRNFDIYESESDLSPRAASAISKFILIMEEAKESLRDGQEAYSAVLKKMTTDLNYFDYLADTQDVDEDRIANVNALFDDINRFIEDNPESTFEEYLQNVSLLSSQDDIKTGNYVSMMTVHTAKGLEFDNVFVISLNEKSFPSSRSIAEKGAEAEEEERRLAYVAFTRAKKKLYLSCNQEYSYVTDSHGSPSQYFEEAGIKMPQEDHFFSQKKSFQGDRYKFSNNRYSRSFFSDGDAIDPFDEYEPKQKPAEEEKPKPKTNGIDDWRVGDDCYHTKFGKGVVKEVINKMMIVVNFESQGTKTMLSNNPSLSKISKGGKA
ncbi:MAG: UvrD-helicase domain-containing protein [Bacilli bacterium]|nr:UvrD-helicase domain-containing protein [Bacilli bacterium]